MRTQNEGSKGPYLYPAVLGGIILLLVFIPLGVNALAPHPVGEVYFEPEQIEDFELPRADGGTFRLSDYKGKTVVIYFGYTSCPDVCPTTLYDLRRTKEQLGGLANEVVIVFITIDPAIDDAEKIEQYLSYFDESFIGLYGTEEQILEVAEQFNIVTKGADETVATYGITHTTSTFIIDSDSYLKLRMHYGQPYDKMANDIKLVARGRI